MPEPLLEARRIVKSFGRVNALRAGTTALVPFAAGVTTLSGELDAFRCLPPDPAAGEGDW